MKAAIVFGTAVVISFALGFSENGLVAGARVSAVQTTAPVADDHNGVVYRIRPAGAGR